MDARGAPKRHVLIVKQSKSEFSTFQMKHVVVPPRSLKLWPDGLFFNSTAWFEHSLVLIENLKILPGYQTFFFHLKIVDDFWDQQYKIGGNFSNSKNEIQHFVLIIWFSFWVKIFPGAWTPEVNCYTWYHVVTYHKPLFFSFIVNYYFCSGTSSRW